MTFKKLFTPFTLLLCLLTVHLPLAQAQNVIQGNKSIDALREADYLLINIASQDAEMLRQAQLAFHFHGGFKLAEGDIASVHASFGPAGSTGVAVLAKSSNGNVLLNETVSLGTREESLMRACDRVVESVLEIPGFFAGKIAFVRSQGGSSEIYLSDVFLQRVKRLTGHGAHSITPHLSPDGTKLTYTSYYKSGAPDLFLMDLGAGRIKPFATYTGTNTGGAFSPSGRQIAMVLSSPGNPELFIQNVNDQTTQARRLTHNRHIDSSPSWSPDGSEIVYSSDPERSPQLFKISSQGGTPQRLPTNISRYCSEPNWNPHIRNLIVFTASEGSRYTLAVYDFNTNQSRFLNVGGGDNIAPVWANDGRHIFFTKKQGSNHQLYLHDMVSGQTEPLSAAAFGQVSQPTYAYPAK